ncbi:DUF4252 domain-containing protein [uncultured Chitinophaga sp.]|jgi:hypothetical protein|uniref:DUF4252 domain-containing protein n=1 Tax=uncultured Chitinophaga sp. TaxID=339340 RepID=UPI00261F36BE|nr:DUF4252 domain-containing protein [uncultured Chitinophaga sp.]
MKRCIILSAFLLMGAIPALCQQKYLKSFQREYYDKATTFRMGLGFLIKLGANVIPASAFDDEDGVIIKRMFRKVNSMKLYVISADDSETISSKDVHRLRQTLISKSGLEPLLEVRDKDNSVYMLNKGKGDELGNVVMLIKDEKELVMLHFHTSMLMSDIQGLIDKAIASNNPGTSN